MFLKKATALALLALAPTLLAACGSDGGDLSGSAVEDPGKPVETGNPPVDPVTPPAEKPGDSEPAAVDPVALQKAANGLRLGVGMTVEWAGVKGMLGDDVAAAVEGYAGDTTLIHSGTLTDLLDGKSVDAVAVGDLLDEIASAQP